MLVFLVSLPLLVGHISLAREESSQFLTKLFRVLGDTQRADVEGLVSRCVDVDSPPYFHYRISALPSTGLLVSESKPPWVSSLYRKPSLHLPGGGWQVMWLHKVGDRLGSVTILLQLAEDAAVGSPSPPDVLSSPEPPVSVALPRSQTQLLFVLFDLHVGSALSASLSQLSLVPLPSSFQNVIGLTFLIWCHLLDHSLCPSHFMTSYSSFVSLGVFNRDQGEENLHN